MLHLQAGFELSEVVCYRVTSKSAGDSRYKPDSNWIMSAAAAPDDRLFVGDSSGYLTQRYPGDTEQWRKVQ